MFGIEIRTLLLSAWDEGMIGAGYVFLGKDVAELISVEQSYRPELDSVIYDGLLSAELVTAEGDIQEEFAKKVIAGLQHPAFAHLPHLPPDSHPEEVTAFASE